MKVRTDHLHLFAIVSHFCLRVFDALFTYLHVFVCYCNVDKPLKADNSAPPPATTSTKAVRDRYGYCDATKGARDAYEPQGMSFIYLCFFSLLNNYILGTLYICMNDDDDDMATSQTPPSLQMRVGGAVLLCITTTPLHTHVMTPPSLQM
jgi:hypothetical protein